MTIIQDKSSKKLEYLKFLMDQLESFRRITKFGFSFVPADNKYDSLKTTGFRGVHHFCEIIQSDPVGRRRCTEEQRVIDIMMRTRKPLIETCHAGLIDIFIPVFLDSDFIGFFCFGKFLFHPPSEEHFEEVLEKTSNLDIDRKKLREEYLKVRIFQKEYIDLITQIFSPLADKIIQLELDIVEEKKKVEQLSALLFEKNFCAEIIGRSEKMGAVFDYLDRINKSDGNVLICGESGTGKELIARYIYTNSGRKKKPFITVNCASFSDNILESELFGHLKGAFSGAISDRIGILETVSGGTLCLDEIAEINLDFQKTLLRVIEEKEIKPVGSDKIKKIDVRFIASTNKDLEDQVRKGRFREDLYYRLNVFQVVLPPLRERPEDIPLLLDHFYQKQLEKYGDKELSFTRKAIEVLMKYDWPGNIRELRNLMENIYFLADGQVTISMVSSYLKLDDKQKFTHSAEGENNYKSAMVDFEREFLLLKLEENDWNISATARKLGITREWLSRKIKRLKLKEQSLISFA